MRMEPKFWQDLECTIPAHVGDTVAVAEWVKPDWLLDANSTSVYPPVRPQPKLGQDQHGRFFVTFERGQVYGVFAR